MKLRITISKYHSWYLCQISLQIMLLPILLLIFNLFTPLHATNVKHTFKHDAPKIKTFYSWKDRLHTKYRVNFPKFKIKNLLFVLFHWLKTLTQTLLKLYMWTRSVSANCCTCEWLGYQYFSWEMNSFLILSSDEYSRMLVSRNSKLKIRKSI